MADQTGDGPTGQAPPPPPVDPLLAPRLTAEQLALLRGYGEKRPTVAGQVLFREGDRGYDFIVDGLGVGGQIGTTSSIKNYLGFPVGVSGEEFAERALVQVLRFGATLLVPSTAAGLAGRGDRYVIQLGARGSPASSPTA
jgi:hypothetical protein